MTRTALARRQPATLTHQLTDAIDHLQRAIDRYRSRGDGRSLRVMTARRVRLRQIVASITKEG